MRKIILGIFAHPDDEAFGPAGTLLRETKAGAELHLFTLTAGESGSNPDQLPNLGDVRLQEWRTAGELIGVKSMHHLGLTDGELGNKSMLQAIALIKDIVLKIVQLHTEPVEIDIISMDTNGISGHIDHIVTSRAAHHLFYSLKQQGLPMGRLRLVCIPRSQTGDNPNINYVFMEPGRLPEEIDETIDNRAYIDDILAIMRAHQTQRSDGEHHIRTLGDQIAIDYFINKP